MAKMAKMAKMKKKKCNTYKDGDGHNLAEAGDNDMAQAGTTHGNASLTAGGGNSAGVAQDGDAVNNTGPTATTGVGKDSSVEAGADDSEQVGTEDGGATRATRMGVVEDSSIEGGADDSEQVAADNGDAKRAADSGDTSGNKQDGNAGSATGPTTLTVIVVESLVVAGTEDITQAITDNGIRKEVVVIATPLERKITTKSPPLCPILTQPALPECSKAPPLPRWLLSTKIISISIA
jgi:hypothetical protein